MRLKRVLKCNLNSGIPVFIRHSVMYARYAKYVSLKSAKNFSFLETSNVIKGSIICVAKFRKLRIHIKLKVDISSTSTPHIMINGRRSQANRRKHFMIIQNV